MVERLPRPARKSRYPWATLTDGQARKLTRGKHFDATVRGMRSTLKAYAQRNDIAVAIVCRSEDDDPSAPERHVWVQFFPGRRYREGPPPDLWGADGS